MKPTVRLVCAKGFKSCHENKVQAFLGKANVSKAVAELWNAYWDVDDNIEDLTGEDLKHNNSTKFMYDWNGGCFLVNAWESFGINDLVCLFEQVLKIPVVVDSGPDSDE